MPLTTTWLGPAQRRQAERWLQSDPLVDLLVVGAGVTGAGVALDAAARGLSVLLVDKADLAHGTSRWSSKLVHGGLRYLAGGDARLAWESARERDVLMRHTAPHLVRALPFLTPLDDSVSRPEEAEWRAGLWLADRLRAAARTPRSVLPDSTRIGAEQALRLFPAFDAAALRGALVHWDGQLEDDARLVVALVRTAAGFGAKVLTGLQAEVVHADGATLVTAGQDRLDVRARAVVNATGVWAPTLAPGLRLRPSRGAHLVLRAETLGRPRVAVNVQIPGQHNRYVFALPHPDGLVYLGLTDDPVHAVTDEPEVTADDRALLLGTIDTVLGRPIDEAEVAGGYAGLRPLIAGAAGSTADLSRRHLVTEDPPGVVTVVGGKLTTYRRMAQDAVDRAVALRGLSAGRCRTHRLALVGAVPPGAAGSIRAPARLVRRYGAEAEALVRLAADDPSLLEPVLPGWPVLKVELAFGVLAEGARSADDLIERRTRLSFVPELADAARPVAERLVGSLIPG